MFRLDLPALFALLVDADGEQVVSVDDHHRSGERSAVDEGRRLLVVAEARAGAVQVDGQNIFLYHCRADGEVDAEFGVGVAGPFAPTGAVRYVELPTGQVATATHVGDYSGLRATHDAILAWCRANGRRLTDHSWEIYGHFDPAVPPRTDIYYLLAEEQGDRGVLEVTR